MQPPRGSISTASTLSVGSTQHHGSPSEPGPGSLPLLFQSARLPTPDSEDERDGLSNRGSSILDDVSWPVSPIIKAEADVFDSIDFTAKPKRGRPRKATTTSPTFKGTKGRSKTGCLTCRRRKKKCDEGKPECQNCLKNSVLCEGYPPRTLWRGGSTSSSSKHDRRPSEMAALARTLPTTLPVLVDGIETKLDRTFLDHLVLNVTPKLSVQEKEGANPFNDILLPMAMKHKGLMHALLCLAGTHLAGQNPELYVKRRDHHYGEALNLLQAQMGSAGNDADSELLNDPATATTLVLCLNAICAGDTNGEYSMHLDATRDLASRHPSRSTAFNLFIWEFFEYHDAISSITNLDRRNTSKDKNVKLPALISPNPGTEMFVGVVDGICDFLKQITVIRDDVRTRIRGNVEPYVSHEKLHDALELDAELRNWHSPYQEGSQRWLASQLYRHAAWVYLYRTIQESIGTPKVIEAVEAGMTFLRQLPADDSTQSILLLPLFLLGCSAFDQRHRNEISKGFDDIQNYSSLGNIKYGRSVVELVWRMIDEGSRDNWDWETIIQNKGWNFLIS